MKKERARIILVEDEAATRQALSQAVLATADFELVASCPNFETGLSAIKSHQIDVLVTDLQLPDGSGIDLIRETRRRHPETEIMVISILGDETTVVSAISAGASGFLLKDAQQIDLVLSIKDLLQGNSPISTAVARYIIKLAQTLPEVLEKDDGPLTGSDLAPNGNGHPFDPHKGLTERELDILWGIAKGFTYKDVAERLGISPNTIPSHIKNIYRKLEVNSRGEAVFEAIQRGIIKLS